MAAPSSSVILQQVWHEAHNDLDVAELVITLTSLQLHTLAVQIAVLAMAVTEVLTCAHTQGQNLVSVRAKECS